MIEGETLWELVDKRAAATPAAEMAVDDAGRRMTFGELRDRSERVAAALAERGVGPGVTVTWELPTWLESMVLAAALARLGAKQNPIVHIYREREVSFCVRQTGASMLVVPTSFANFGFGDMAHKIAADIAREGGELAVLTCDRDLAEADPSRLGTPPTSGEEIRWYFYTSGTTAEPKGAQHTDQTIYMLARGIIERFGVTGDDRNALVFPFPHLGGIAWLFVSLMTGCVNILLEAFVPDRVVEVLDAEGVTLAGAGTVFHQTYLAAQAKSDRQLFANVRAFPGGGARKPPQLHYDMRAAFPSSAGIFSGYGLTEAPILTMSGVANSDEDLANTEGSAMPGVVLKLIKEDGTLAGPGEEGEIRARAPQLMKGYVDSELDDEAFDGEGYFCTGDLGVLNDRGMLVISGRLKDIIIRKGENVSAKEVEDHLWTHPKVGDVAVIGLPDPVTGERVCAVVVTAPGQEPITFEEMTQQLLSAGLMSQKIPEQLEIVESLPRNPAGKVLKRDLQARLESTRPDRRG